MISARAVADAIRRAGMRCVPIGVTGEGRWLAPERSAAILDGEDRRVESSSGPDGGSLVLDPGGRTLLRLVEDSPSQPVELDVIFPLIHGRGGEDGRLQGTLELCGIPYVGAGVLGSAAAMDKALARRVFEAHRLPGVRWLSLHRETYRRGAPAERTRIASELGFPVFVKPSNGGSSVGISRVAHAEQLAAALDEAFACDRRVVIEEGLDAREIECAVLGNESPEASGLGEIIPSREFYDYTAKYLDGTSELQIPARVDPAVVETIREHALAAFSALGLRGFARVDFLLGRDSGRVALNEVNTLPGFTPISMFPMLWEASGLPFPRLIERLVELALDHWREERSLRTSL